MAPRRGYRFRRIPDSRSLSPSNLTHTYTHTRSTERGQRAIETEIKNRRSFPPKASPRRLSSRPICSGSKVRFSAMQKREREKRHTHVHGVGK